MGGCVDRASPPAATTAEILATQGAAQAFFQQDRLEEARAEYEQLVEMVPSDASGHAGLGMVALRSGNVEAAEKHLIAARERSPSDPELVVALANARSSLGDGDSARALLTRSLALDSTHTRTLWALADIARLDGQPVESWLVWLERVVALVPGNLAARVELSGAYLEANALDQALAELEMLRQIAPDFPPRARTAFEKTERAIQVGDRSNAVAQLAEFRLDFEVTAQYQEGVADLRPLSGEIVGIPQLYFSFLTSLRVQEPEVVLNSMRFTNASELAGFGELQSVSEEHGGAALFALGDFDGDEDEDLLWTVGGETSLLRVDFGQFVVDDDLGSMPTPEVGAIAWGDFDDDRRLDMWLGGRESALYHNESDGLFSEILLPAEGQNFGKANEVFFADLDQDGDLDVFEARSGLNRFYRNDGDKTFVELSERFGLAGPDDADTKDAAFADLDGDLDLDVVLAEGSHGLRVLLNARGGRFSDLADRVVVDGGENATAVALGDIDNDGLVDVLVAGSQEIRLLKGQVDSVSGLEENSRTIIEFEDLVPRDLLLVDFDNDGYLDLAVGGSSEVGAGARLFHNIGGGNFSVTDHLLPDVPSDIRQLDFFDYNEDGDADLIILDSDGQPMLLRNDGGNANHFIQLQLVGLGDGSRKNNRFGIGARVEIRAGDLYQVHTVTDPTVLIGLNGHLKADVIRVHWPNGVAQDLYFPGTDQDLIEQQTLKGSCPLLYVWDGESFTFVGDIMWKSALGMPLGILGGDGQQAFAPSYPSQEYRRLPPGLLRPRDGEFVLQVTEELWETIYVDGLSLVAVDHPDSVDVYVNERFIPPAPTELELWRVGDRWSPRTASDGRGVDQSSALEARDFSYVSTFRTGRYQGIAEPHELILDLGEKAASGDVTLFLTGWIFPTDASINMAMAQSDDLQSHFPALDVIGLDGKWETVIPDLGFPSGKDKTVIADLRGLFPTEDRRVRIHTNLMVYWDEAFFTVGSSHLATTEQRVTEVSATSADLHYRGFSREFRKGGRYGPHWFDYDSVTVEPRWHDLAGEYTRFGDVTELVESGDDRYVIANAGDEITLRFSADEFPDLPQGWMRTFLIYSDGWVKDGDLNIATGDRADPLPFRDQTRYPYGPEESYDHVDARRETAETYLTRTIKPPR